MPAVALLPAALMRLAAVSAGKHFIAAFSPGVTMKVF
jgi:hypothetical protein